MLDRMKGPILKTQEEIHVMDRANRIVLDILEMMRSMVKPGATTAQLNAVAEEELARRGAKSPFKGYAPMNLPPVRAWLSERDLPPAPSKSFREMWRRR